MKPGHGRADYLLYLDRRAVGVIEAKPQGTTLSGVEWQSAMYADGLPEAIAKRAVTIEGRLPFVIEANGSETHFTNGFDPHPRARRLFNVPKPETLAKVIRDAEADPDMPTWRAKVQHLPPLETSALRPAQITAIEGVERSLAEQRFDRSLVQMATGAGKTYTAVTEAYRLLTFGGFQRVLFLVDRNNLADQTLAEFQNYRTPGDGRRFTELYPVNKLTSAGMLGSSSVVISTIQRVYKVLQGDQVADVDDPGLDDFVPDAPVTVSYAKELPPESFDLVIVDEAHRSIYGVWRGVLEYFDAHVIGLTATPRQADLRVLPAEPGLGVHLPPVGRRPGQRRLRHLPDPHRDLRAGCAHRGRHHRPEDRPPHPRGTARGVGRGLRVHPQAARPRRHRTQPDQARPGDLPGPAAHGDLPGADHRAEDADLRQGRRPRGGDRHHRARGLRQGQRLRRQDHVHRERRQGPAPGLPHQPNACGSRSPST